jgi:hypothetical protein
MKHSNCGFWRTAIVGALALGIVINSPVSGWAMLAPADTLGDRGETLSTRAEDLKTIQKTMESKIFRERLADLKLTPAQIDARLSKLSDAQLHQTASRIRTIAPGGDAGGVLITVLVVAILVGLFFYVFRRI